MDPVLAKDYLKLKLQGISRLYLAETVEAGNTTCTKRPRYLVSCKYLDSIIAITAGITKV